MVTLHSGKQIIIDNKRIASKEEAVAISQEEAFKNTLTYQVLKKHNHSDNMEHLQIQFDSMGVYDNTYVGILQTAYASGLKEFPMPCVFTNCHNCLCAVGGTINTDVHKYAESACKKSGGIFVPPHEAVIHQYMREMIVKSGDMSIVSDSHTRYGTQGSLSIGEGGPELAKAMLGKYYEIDYPEVIAVFLTVIAVGTNAGIHPVICAVIGALLGFLCFNTHPAKVFMGDTGSLALGGVMSTIAVLTHREVTLAVVASIFIIETLSVILQVFWLYVFKKKLFLMTPLHHHFEKLGWKEQDIVKLFWVVGLVLAMGGIFFGVWL